MRLSAEIDADQFMIEIKQNAEKLLALVEDRNYDLEVSEPEPNVFLLKHDGKIFEAFVSNQKDSNAPFAVRIGSHEIEIRLTDPKRLRGSVKTDEQAGGLAEIKTAMPGKVVRILVSVGDAVQKGDGVIVVEAMKMQNEMKSPKDGVVKTIKATENDTVSAGDVLLVIE